MGMYLKGYVQRVAAIITVIAVILASSLLSYGLFHKKLNSVSGQLNSYNSADYSIIYILDYGEAFNNECLYPDTDVQFYRDADKSHRLTVSSIMREEGVSYNLAYLAPLSQLLPGEMCIPQNIADAYELSVGDTIYAEYPYSVTPEPVTVSAIMRTEYDYEHPVLDNDIGVVFLGFNEKHAVNTNGKFVLFAEESRAEELSAFPQIIKDVINKSECISTVLSQGTAALLFEAIFALASVILVHMAFFSRSYLPLHRCYLKGMKRFFMVAVPFIERLTFCLLPWTVIQHMATSGIPDSPVTMEYRIVPICICGSYCVITLIVDALKLRRKGG